MRARDLPDPCVSACNRSPVALNKCAHPRQVRKNTSGFLSSRLAARQAMTLMTSAWLARGLRRSEPINKGTLRSSASRVKAGARGSTRDLCENCFIFFYFILFFHFYVFLFFNVEFFQRWTKRLGYLGKKSEVRKIFWKKYRIITFLSLSLSLSL